MSGKSDKDRQEHIVKMAAEIGAKAGVEAYQKAMKLAQDERADKRLRNTRLLLRNYRLFKDHAENAIYDLDELVAEESVYDILEIMQGHDTSLFVESIKQSVARTVMIVKHIETMLALYETYTIRSGSQEEQRRYRVIQALYIDENPTPIPELAQFEQIAERTVYKDIDSACEKLSALIFGIDGVRKN